MPHVQFGPPGRDSCPVCFLLQGNLDKGDCVASGLALGLASVAMAESPVEVGEILAQACREHQQRVAQFVYGWTQMAKVDFTAVMQRLGALPSSPPPETVIHLVDGKRTRCDQRAVDDQWPDNERFVYPDKAEHVNCPACRAAILSR